jgi:hypothetical protein
MARIGILDALFVPQRENTYRTKINNLITSPEIRFIPNWDGSQPFVKFPNYNPCDSHELPKWNGTPFFFENPAQMN